MLKRKGKQPSKREKKPEPGKKAISRKRMRATELLARQSAVNRLALEIFQRANSGRPINKSKLKAFSSLVEDILRGEVTEEISREEIEGLTKRFEEIYAKEKARFG